MNSKRLNVVANVSRKSIRGLAIPAAISGFAARCQTVSMLSSRYPQTCVSCRLRFFRFSNIKLDEMKPRTEACRNEIGHDAPTEIVDADHDGAVAEEPVDQVAADETRPRPSPTSTSKPPQRAQTERNVHS